jgi:hypothetical protein
MKPKIPLNPFEEQSEEYHKNPKDMSLEELELLLYTKRMELKLDVMRLETKVNYTKVIIETIVALGIPEKIETFFLGMYDMYKPKSDKSKTNL